MVDATASFDGNRLAATEASPRTLPRDQAGPSTSVVSAEGLTAYAEFCRSALFAPAQSAAWVLNWAAQLDPDLLVATLSAEGRPVFSLALEVSRTGPFRVARFMGGRHANGNFIAVDPQWLARPDIPAIRSMLTAIAKARRTSTSWHWKDCCPISMALPIHSPRLTISPAPICRWLLISPMASMRCCCAPAASASARSTARRCASSRPSAPIAASRPRLRTR